MKTHNYYSCVNCGKIAAADPGNRYTACPDCGSGGLRALVPIESAEESTPLSKRHKTLLATCVGTLGLLAVAVFLVFGLLLRGYMAIEAKREFAEAHDQRLAADISAKETVLNSLNKQIGEERSKSLATVNSAKADLVETEKALERGRASLTNESAKVAAVRSELADLDDQRGKLRKDVETYSGRKEAIQTEIRDSESAKATLQAALVELKKQTADARAEAASIRAALESLHTMREKARDEADAQTERAVKAGALAARKATLDTEVSALEKTQISLEARVSELKKQLSGSESDIARLRAAIETLTSTRDKTREEADAQSARVATIISNLDARKKDLDAQIDDRQRTKTNLEAALVELKKQVTESAHEAEQLRAAIQTLNTMRDKAREEADAESARAATLSAEAAALERTRDSRKKT